VRRKKIVSVIVLIVISAILVACNNVPKGVIAAAENFAGGEFISAVEIKNVDTLYYYERGSAGSVNWDKIVETEVDGGPVSVWCVGTKSRTGQLDLHIVVDNFLFEPFATGSLFELYGCEVDFDKWKEKAGVRY
jgi:hypothetical protein